MSKLITINYEDIMAYEYSYSIPSQYSQLRSYAKRTIDYDLPYYGYFKTTKNYVASSREYYQLRNSFSTNSASDNLYPIAVRHVTKDNIYVIERPPFQLEVDFRLGSANSQAPKMYPLKIWIPWTVMLIKLDSFTSGSLSSVRLYFNDGPISSLDDVLFSPWLPNAYSNGGICFSNSMDDFAHVLDNDRISSNDINYIYNYIFNNYMMGGWNSDLDSYLPTKFYRAVAANRTSQPANVRKSFPMLELFVDPKQDEDFYKKIASSVPKVLFNKLKKMFSRETFSYIHGNASKEKMFSRNFLIFSAFSLEQKINLISELKEIVSTNYLGSEHTANKNSYTLRSIIEKMDRSVEDLSSDNTSITSLLKQSEGLPVQLDYKVTKVDFYIKNPPMFFNEQALEAIVQMDKWILINDIILDNINSNDPPIAIEYDYANHSFDVIVQYSQREYFSVLFTEILTKYQERINADPDAKNLASRITISFFEDIIKNGLDTYLNNLERV